MAGQRGRAYARAGVCPPPGERAQGVLHGVGRSMERADAASGVAIWSRAYAVENRLPVTETGFGFGAGAMLAPRFQLVLACLHVDCDSGGEMPRGIFRHLAACLLSSTLLFPKSVV